MADIQNNDKYEGYFIKDNDIIKTLDLRKYKNGVGNRITRLLFDASILLYVDRFCPERPTKADTAMLDQFVLFAFIWAYSMRAQYYNVGWLAAQGYIMGNGIVNSFNIYRVITEADSPVALLSVLSDKVEPLPYNQVADNAKKGGIEEKDGEGADIIWQNYLHFFKEHKFMEGDNEN